MVVIKRFNGVMNTDDGDDFILPPQHKYALNGRFYGTEQGLRFENIKGNTLIANSYLPTGTNQCIGSFYDTVRQRIIWFNWNSTNKHGIYQYNVKTAVVSEILVSFTDSQADIFSFDRNYPIASVVMIYRSEEEGDLLHWLARDNRPMKLNLKDATDDLYGTDWTADYLYVARPMPLISPTCTYINDATINMNNMYKRLFMFRYRWVYADDTKSTWSPYSKIPAPSNPDDIATAIDPTKNNRIDVLIRTGAADVVKIEVAYRFSLGTAFSDNYLITSLDKSDLTISDDTTYLYSFLNDGSYTSLGTDEPNLLFDYVPKTANTMELLNGNVIVYGGIVEGYDKDVTVDVDTTVTSYANSSTAPLTEYDQIVGRNYEVFFSGTPATGDQVSIHVDGDNGATNDYSYIVLAGDTAEDVRDALLALVNAGGDGFSATTRTDISGNFGLRISHTGLVFVTGSTTIVYTGTPSAPPGEIGSSCYRPNSRYKFGLVYFDKFGVTPGVVTSDDMSVITPELNTTGQSQFNIPLIEFSINHTPPDWAYFYAFVRSDNLTTIANLFGVSQATLLDTSATVHYAYLNITNIQTNENNLPVYEFTEGDRIRIVLGPYAGSFTSVKEFPIVSLEVDPVINSVAQTGSFIKVPYNSSLSSFGTAPYDNMFFEIYTPSASLSATQTLFYEFGEQFEIGDAGLSTRYHKGQVQDQDPGVTPATFQFSRGDYYIRQRTEPITDDSSLNNTFWICDRSVSDQYTSRVNGNGRAFVIDENAKETTNKVLIRWSQEYQQGTSINRTNRFYPANFDEADRSKGDIQRFKARDRMLRVFQNRGCGQYGIYARFIQNNDGQSELVTTDEIITTNNISYYQGEFGVGDQYTGLVSATNRDYFVDPVRGYQVRLSNDGLTPISEVFKGQFYIRGLLTPYNKTWARSDGSNAKIIGYYDYFDEQYVCVLQGGTNGDNTIDDTAFSWNEMRNGYCSFYSFAPEWIICAEDVTFSWKNGQLYSHNSETYCNFYGTQYDTYIDVVFNDNLAEKKTWNSISEIAGSVWTIPLAYTNVMSYGSQRQETSLIAQEFATLEGNYHASFKRDSHSRGGKINGGTMKGNYMVVRFYQASASSLVSLSEVRMKYLSSPLT